MSEITKSIYVFFDSRQALKDRLRPIVRLVRQRAGALRHFGRTRSLRRKHGDYEQHFRSARRVGDSPASDRSIVMLAVADLKSDPRIEREARALAAAGYEVTIVCTGQLGRRREQIDWGKGIHFKIIPSYMGDFAFEAPGYLGEAFFLEAAEYQPFAFHAHDLYMAHIGIAAAKKSGAHLVCDFHEWISENVSYNIGKKAFEPHSQEQKDIYKWLELETLRQASAVVTVCDSIADAIAEEFETKRRPIVIRNIPAMNAEPTRIYPPLKRQLGLPDDRFVLLWQGGTGPSRMIEPIIEALRYAPRCTLVIRGPSLETYGGGYRAIARAGGFEDRLILLPPVPSRDVVAAARGADAGIWTLPNLCRNFTFALPNKIFEYIAAGLPLLAADYPEARRMAESHGVGLLFDPYDPKSIAAAINRLVDEPELRVRFTANTVAALASMDAEREWRKLVEVYDALRLAEPVA